MLAQAGYQSWTVPAQSQSQRVLSKRGRGLDYVIRALLGKVAEAAGELRPLADRSLRVKRYRIDDRPAFVARLSHKNEFKVELYDGYYSVVWSTRLDLASFSQRLATLTQLETAATALWDRGDDGADHMVTATVPGSVNVASGVQHDFARFELSDKTFTWEPASKGFPGRVGLLADAWDERFVAELIRETADQPIASKTIDLVDESSYVASHLPASTR
ncbi:MAG: hypothetical protein ABR992_15705 [Solirubrobacteraceae bacterium]